MGMDRDVIIKEKERSRERKTLDKATERNSAIVGIDTEQ